MNVPDPSGQKKKDSDHRQNSCRQEFIPSARQQKKNRSSFFQDMNMYTRFPPKRTDQKKIFHPHCQQKFFFSCLNDSPEHYPTAFAQIQEPFTLFACNGQSYKTRNHFFFPSSSRMLSICPQTHISTAV